MPAAWAAGWRWLAAAGRWPVFVRDEAEDGEFTERWEWWREKEGRSFSCCLPPLLMESVRRSNRTSAGATCRFPKQGAALAAAAWCAGQMILTNGSIE